MSGYRRISTGEAYDFKTPLVHSEDDSKSVPSPLALSTWDADTMAKFDIEPIPAPPPTDDELREQKRQERLAREKAGFDFNGQTVSFEEKDRNGIANVKVAFDALVEGGADPATLGGTFHCQNGTQVVFDMTILGQLVVAITAATQASFETYTSELAAI